MSLLLERLAPGECPSGYVYYSCNNGFKGCCSVPACDASSGCPAGKAWPGLSSIGSATSAATDPATAPALTVIPTSDATTTDTPTAVSATQTPIATTTSSAATATSCSASSSGCAGPAATGLAPDSAAQSAGRTPFPPAIIAALVVCGLFVVLSVGLVVWVLRRRRRKQADAHSGGDDDGPHRTFSTRLFGISRHHADASSSTLRDSVMQEAGERAARKARHLSLQAAHPQQIAASAGSRAYGGVIENPKDGLFEEVGGRYHSPDSVAGRVADGGRMDLDTSVASYGSTTRGGGDNVDESGLVSPLSPRLARPQVLTTTPILELEGTPPIPIAELESPSTPTFGSARLPGSTSPANANYNDESTLITGWKRPRKSGYSLVNTNTPSGGHRTGAEEASVPGPAENPRATLFITAHERSRGEHVASWNSYD